MKKIILLGLMLLVVFPIIGYSQEGPVDPLMGAKPFGEEYATPPALVWKVGKIDVVKEDRVIIDDATYKLTENTKFYSASGNELTLLNFHPGTSVKFVLKQDLRTIVSLVKVR